MATISMRIENLDQIKAAFSQAPVKMGRKLDEAIRKSVLTIQRQSMQNTPVDTGRLRASTRTAFRPLYGEVGTHVNYDIFVHDGTRFMKARPYLLNAVKSESSSVQGYFRQAVQDVLDDIARGT
jgi:HK97 gp10 family phage protein